MRLNGKRKRTPARETGSFWLSFSDMMSVLVLVFIFVIFSMMLSLADQTEQLKKIEEEYQVAKANAQEEITEKSNIILSLGEQLESLKGELREQAVLLSQIEDLEEKLSDKEIIILGLQNQLSDEQEEKDQLYKRIVMLEGNKSDAEQRINALLKEIDAKKKELETLGIQYNDMAIIANQAKTDLKNAEKSLKDAESVMSTQSRQLSEYRAELERQQNALEDMVGVKTQLIQALSAEFQKQGITASVDQQTGAIALPGGMLFDVGQNTLSFQGMNYLDSFLPVYLKVLLSDRFKDHIAEIIIEGHTDSTGKAGTDAYLYNLELSQARALSVSNYILGEGYMRDTLRLSASERTALRALVTASGRSYSALIYNSNGTENRDASRRVEIKFRLKDDQTITAIENLLSLMNQN